MASESQMLFPRLLLSLPFTYFIPILALTLMALLCLLLITESGCMIWCVMHQEQLKHNLSVLPTQLWLVRWLQIELDDIWHSLWEFLLFPVCQVRQAKVPSCSQAYKDPRRDTALQSKADVGVRPSHFLHRDAQTDMDPRFSCQDPSPPFRDYTVKCGSWTPVSTPKPSFHRASWKGRVPWGTRLGLPGKVRKASSWTTSSWKVDLFISWACLVSPLFILDWVNPPDTNECALVNKHHGLFSFCCCCCC